MARATRRTATLVGLVLATSLAACSTGRTSLAGEPFGASSRRDDHVLVTVENNDFRDATVHALWSGAKVRVGAVTGKTSQTFRIPWRGEELQFDVDFLGHGEYLSERVSVLQGDHLKFIIMAGM